MVFKGKRDGFFVEFGLGDFEGLSNTLLLGKNSCQVDILFLFAGLTAVVPVAGLLVMLITVGGSFLPCGLSRSKPFRRWCMLLLVSVW